MSRSDRAGFVGRGGRSALAILAIALSSACGEPAGAPAPTPAPASGRAVDAVLATGDLIGRYPERPEDPTGPLIEGAFALAVSDDAVYALDGVAGSVLRFDLDGRLTGRSGRPGDGPGELGSPIGIAAAPDGGVWVADPAGGRLVRFGRDGDPLETLRSPVPPVNMAVLPSGDVLLPTLNATTMLARVTADGATELAVDPAAVPPEVSGGPEDRLSLRGLLLTGVTDRRVAMLRNRHGTDFRLWTIELGPAASGIATIAPLPLPDWLYTILEEETDLVRSTAPPSFAEGEFLTPFKGMHAANRRLWLVPAPSSRLIALSVPLEPGEGLTVVVGGREVWDGLIDAAVIDRRLFGLYDTELRVYELDESPVPFELD